MKGFSLENADFKRISFSQISTLLDTVSRSGIKDIAYIKEKYSKVGAYFDDTFQFLLKLGVFNIIENQIILTPPLTSEIKPYFLSYLFKKAYRTPILESYLKNFTSTQKETYSFHPTEKLNVQTSGIRNLLLELGVLDYERDTRTYSISDEGLPYLKTFFRHTSAVELERILRNRNGLGLRAELVILALEKRKLKDSPHLQKRVFHTSRFDVGAGYDIQSFAPNISGTHKPKYIEVKAVSEKDFEFFWSSNEIEVAKELGEQYNLYLLPVSKGGKFALKKLKVIQNPYREFFTEKKGKLDVMLYRVSPYPKKR